MSNVIEKAIEWAVDIANDNSHGYDQIGRWGDDYDCSSLVIYAYEQAGVPVKEAGATYTGNMLSAFKKCGFEAIPYKKGMNLIAGDVLLNKKHHTVLYIGDNKIVQASINEKGGIYNGKDGDQTGKEIAVGKFYEYSKGWDVVLRYPDTEKDTSQKPQNATKLSEEEIALQVINGMWGNGKERQQRLAEAGYDYDVIQKIVNKKLGKSSKPAPEKPKTFIGIVNTIKDPLRVRIVPNGTIVKLLPKGSKVELMNDPINGWYKLADGSGFVSAKYIMKK
jgi:hypothetical protein